MANESRKYTRALLNAIDNGVLDAKAVLLLCVNYMSEFEVEEMVYQNDLDEAIGIPEEE